MDYANTLLTLGYTTQDQLNTISEIIKNSVLHIDFTNDIRGVEI